MAGLLDEAIKVGQKLEGATNQLKSIQARIDQADKRLRETESDATRKGRVILQEAKDQASVILHAAERTSQTAARLLKEAEARDQATSWVKEEQKVLTAKAKNVADREKESDRVKSEATASKELYISHLQAIKVTEDALGERERKLLGKLASAKPPTQDIPAEQPKKRGRPPKKS